MKKVEGLKKNRKTILIVAVIVLVVICVIWKIVASVKGAMAMLGEGQDMQGTEAVQQMDLVNSVTATGKIVPVDKRSVSSSITGVDIKEINVAVGDYVQAGDLLCLLDDEGFEGQLADAQTVLNADNGKIGLDVQSSNRTLGEAVETRNIDAQRAEQDKSSAYGKFAGAADECQEAKDDYDSAHNTTDDLKGKMDSAKKDLDAARNSGVATLSDAEKTAALNPYSAAFSRLETYISGLNTTEASKISSTWKDTIDPANILSGSSDFNLSGTSVSMIYNGDDSDVISRISSSLSELSSYYSQYQSALSAGSMMKEANIANAEAAYAQAKANYEAALAKEESLKAAYESKVKTVESYYDSYTQTVRNADDRSRQDNSTIASSQESLKRSQLNASSATVNEKRNIAELQEKIDSCEIRASIGGLVTAVNFNAGEFYTGGALLTIENTTDYEVSAQIDEYDISKVKVGQDVIIKTNGTGTQEFKGVVKSVAPHATENVGSNGVKYEVRVSILDHCDDFKLDMTAKIEIISEKSDGALVVPAEAIQETDDGRFFVEVYDGSSASDTSDDEETDTDSDEGVVAVGSDNRIYVTKGIVGDYYTEISGDGIKEGLKVVIPSEGNMSDLDTYADEAGATGGF